MRARFKLTDEEYTLRLSTDSAASSYGQPVLETEDGEPVDRFSWALYEVVDATEDERAALRAAGYDC